MDIIYEHYNPNLGVKCINIMLQHNTKLQFLACDKRHDLPFETNPLIHWVCIQLGTVEIFYVQIDYYCSWSGHTALLNWVVGLRYWWRCCMSAGRGTRDQLNTDIPRRFRRLNFIIIISKVTITNDSCWKVVKSVKPCTHSLSYSSQREDIGYHTMHNSFGFGSGCVKGQLTSHYTPTPSGLVFSHLTTKLSNLETTNF